MIICLECGKTKKGFELEECTCFKNSGICKSCVKKLMYRILEKEEKSCLEIRFNFNKKSIKRR